jgi:adenylate cyclase
MRAIELDPYCVRAHSIAAYYTGLEVLWGWKSRQDASPLALDAAHNAILLDDQDPWAHFALGWALTQNRSPEAGIEEYQRAIAINPYFPSAYSCLGLALSYVGEIEMAVTALDNGERLGAPEIFLGLANSARAGVYSCAEMRGDAIKAARRSVQQGPGLVASQRHLVVNYALAGELEEARAAFETLVHLVPNPSLSSIASALPYVRDNDLNRTLDGFRLMGVR